MKTKPSVKSANWVVSGLLFLGSSVSLSLASPSALAAACRDIESVKQSANADSNTGMGGHVTQHILGMQPPPGASQNGKTLFSEKAKFEKAWATYMNVITNPRACSGSSSIQQVFQLGYHIDAFSCRAADGNGKCTRWDSFAADEVAVAFLRQSNGTWILNTAYPIPISP